MTCQPYTVPDISMKKCIDDEDGSNNRGDLDDDWREDGDTQNDDRRDDIECEIDDEIIEDEVERRIKERIPYIYKQVFEELKLYECNTIQNPECPPGM